MQITIRYQRYDEEGPRELNLTPEEYFDPLDPGEVLSVRSVARLLETFEYTPHAAEGLRWTVLEIRDGEEFWRVRTQLLQGTKVLMHHTEETDGSQEIIHSTDVAPGVYHIIRTRKVAGESWTVTMNGLYSEGDGFVDNRLTFGERWSFEQLTAFGRVR